MSADPEFERLVNHYYRDLYGFGFSLTGNEADACDLTQETFFVWASKGHQLKNPASVKAWLFTTLYREFLKICRRRARIADDPIEQAVENLPQVPADCVNQIDSQTLMQFLSEMAEDHRAALLLYYMEDLSYKEIAEVLGVPLGTVQSRIARAKAQLLRRLSGTQPATERSK
jgi:RNA polymerase sigma-70 factor (ECF subfamily)